MNKTALLIAASLLLFTLALGVTMALAQGDSAVARSSWLYELWTVVSPIVTLIVSTAGPFLAGWIAIRLAALLKINDATAQKKLEEQVRNALHSAALNGLKYAMTRAGIPTTASPTAGVIVDAINYIRTKSPDTAKQAGASDEDLEQIILSKFPDVIAMISASKEQSPTATRHDV